MGREARLGERAGEGEGGIEEMPREMSGNGAVWAEGGEGEVAVGRRPCVKLGRDTDVAGAVSVLLRW